MRKQYDDFSQLKLKDMSKSISDMTYMYINKETGEPTKVPPVHYEKLLDQVTENYMSDITSRQFLTIMYTQLVNLKKEDEKYFNQALLCMDLGLNPKDLRVNEQIAIEYTNNFMDEVKAEEKKDFHFLRDDVIETFENSKNDAELQAFAVKKSNQYDRPDNYKKPHYRERDEM